MHAKRDPQPGRNIARALVRSRESAIFLALVLLMTVIGIAAPNFLGAGNLYLVSRQISFVAIVALGELFVILTGGIARSVGSVMALAGVGAASRMTIGVPPPYAVLLGILVGLVMGAVNGALVAYVGIAPFIVTLGMLSFASGLVLGLTKGWPITDVPASFLPIAQGSFLGLPIPVWIAVAIAVLAHLALSTTAFGRRTYAIGGNEQATFLSGIDVKRIKFFLYLIPAACASIAGIILVARFNSAQADTGKGWDRRGACLHPAPGRCGRGRGVGGGGGGVVRRPRPAGRVGERAGRPLRRRPQGAHQEGPGPGAGPQGAGAVGRAQPPPGAARE